MNIFITLLDLASGLRPEPAEASPARSVQLIIAGTISALALAALWGLAAGSTSLSMALANLYKVPVAILLSTISALPAGLLAWKLSTGTCRALHLVQSFVLGVFAAALVLATCAPLVALYYHTSRWGGPMLGLGSMLVAMAVGAITVLRTALRGAPEGVKRRSLLIPVLVLLAMTAATSLQILSIVSPILPERTPVARGIDGVIN